MRRIFSSVAITAPRTCARSGDGDLTRREGMGWKRVPVGPEIFLTLHPELGRFSWALPSYPVKLPFAQAWLSFRRFLVVVVVVVVVVVDV